MRETPLALPGISLADATKHFQREFIRRSIKRADGNMSEAARLLGMSRTNLYRKMRQVGMNDDFTEET